ncbi:ABC transporter permease [Anaerostipes sp.]|uniref:ABC transporter permease n=1 Tax=Anaerostipes sp. TaxID=1872530 RepID=UPI0025C43F27|nr:FtsX-like permease family protein [Anaerostipes sp.]MBS7007602.1 ABC transporter permease [Anaerostipes sp.]
MKKALHKDNFMMVRKTLPRFMSIFFIVALGVAFFSGVRVTEPDMKLTADAQFDESRLMDLRILATMGITDKDVSAVKKISGISAAEPSYSVDTICKLNDTEKVLKVMAATDQFNQIKVTKGRMPEKNGECLIDSYMLEHSDIKVGDTITLSSGTDDDIGDTLKKSVLRIVGAGDSSYYLSRDRGTATIGNGQISGFAVVPKENFKLDVYTDLFLSVKGAEEKTAYTDEYDDTVEKAEKKIKDISGERCEERLKEIKAEATKEVKKAENKYKIEKKKADRKLIKAKKKLDDAESEIRSGQNEIKAQKAKISSGKKEIQKGWESYYSGKKQLAQAEKELKENEKKLDKAEKQLAQAKEQLRQQMQQAGAMGQIPPEMKKKFEQAEKELDSQEAALKASRQKLAKGKKDIKSNKQKLKNSAVLLKKKEKELKSGEQKIKEAETKLANAKKELEKGRKQYRSSKKKADRKFAKAKKKIDDAKKDIDDIKKPKWYVLDRNKIQSYVEYGGDTERIGAIGEVFPVIFFLVAALVSLTTMTRMVEEQRTQIGILKALGYTGFDVAKKYGMYALLATAGGSIAGVLVGETVLPKVIIEAYSMMYTGIGQVKHPFETKFALTASAASVCITFCATMFACYKELREKPAQLMRPEAPKEGKRILLERIGFLWKHLNFTWKSTLRNLFRYKKRFFMTVFGIGGCMALLLVGFGLKDSIFAISKNQYQKIQTYDASVMLEEELSAKKEQEIAFWIQKQHTIRNSTKVHNASVDVEFDGESKSASLVVPENIRELSSYIHFKDRKTGETYKLSENGIILTEKVCSLLGIKEGDTVTLKEGEMKKVRAKVEHITENYMRHSVYMSQALYRKLYGEAPSYNQILLKNKNRSEKLETTLGRQLLKLDGAASVSFISDNEKEMNDMLNNLNIVVFVLIISAGLLAFVVLYNLNNINIAERKTELATIKVLGFYDLETAAYVYRENILLTVIGTAAGAGLGVLLHRYVILTAEVDLIMFGRTIMPASYMYSVLLTIGFAALINFMMFFQLRKINMVESLKSTE